MTSQERFEYWVMANYGVTVHEVQPDELRDMKDEYIEILSLEISKHGRA